MALNGPLVGKGGDKSPHHGLQCWTWYKVWVHFEEPLFLSRSSWARWCGCRVCRSLISSNMCPILHGEVYGNRKGGVDTAQCKSYIYTYVHVCEYSPVMVWGLSCLC